MLAANDRGSFCAYILFILFVFTRSIVSKTDLQSLEANSWEELRRKSSLLGIPAWKLAEELAFHERNSQLVSVKPLNR